MLYNDFSAFTEDQERLISNNGFKQNNALDYLEGLLLLNQGPPDNWRSSFFPLSDHANIISLVTKYGIVYCLEIAKFYDDHTLISMEEVNRNDHHQINIIRSYTKLHLKFLDSNPLEFPA